LRIGRRLFRCGRADARGARHAGDPDATNQVLDTVVKRLEAKEDINE
jgi:hypothetical protein